MYCFVFGICVFTLFKVYTFVRLFDISIHTEQNRTLICEDLYIPTSSYKTVDTTMYTWHSIIINLQWKYILINHNVFVKLRATLIYINSFYINLVVQINNISLHILGIRSKYFSTTRNSLTYINTHTLLLCNAWQIRNNNYNNNTTCNSKFEWTFLYPVKT